jgi:predicted regulator of Ras-like GTPase activity (Roadblock/LC7/MglB family)
MRSDFALPVEMADQIELILARVRRMTEAECVMLVDVSGQLISMQGQVQESDPVLVAALAAGDVAAIAELSRQIGEENPSGAFFHEGEHKSIYLANVAGSFVMIVIFRADTPIGLVRLFGGRAAEQLRSLASAFEELLSQPDEPSAPDFSAALAEELERAFSEA